MTEKEKKERWFCRKNCNSGFVHSKNRKVHETEKCIIYGGEIDRRRKIEFKQACEESKAVDGTLLHSSRFFQKIMEQKARINNEANNNDNTINQQNNSPTSTSDPLPLDRIIKEVIEKISNIRCDENKDKSQKINSSYKIKVKDEESQESVKKEDSSSEDEEDSSSEDEEDSSSEEEKDSSSEEEEEQSSSEKDEEEKESSDEDEEGIVIKKTFEIGELNLPLTFHGTWEEPLFDPHEVGEILGLKNIRTSMQDLGDDEKDGVHTMNNVFFLLTMNAL